jgi:hypothetical protein
MNVIILDVNAGPYLEGMSILALVDSSKNALVDPEGHGSSDQGLVSMSLNFLASLLTPLSNELECSPLVTPLQPSPVFGG